ncbi:DNA polymerase III subunit delta [Micrococcus sp. TA1]|uniref:DNA polymerase III subunit delta n=1 Tax=Micrococcus sp. TA1 TaxID=681627 RepID=UPI00160FF4CC|nr:DNA polymerase III subunit delta [Micrococcus sp. TA1]MBB5749062.1 DNA polymerase-3 subunit delta [Micrococcus sp. TA1]
MPAPSRSRRSTSSGTDWRRVEPAPLMLLKGPEDFIATRVTDRVRTALRQADPGLELHRLDAADYQSGQLSMLASPSLFGEAKIVLAEGLQDMNEAFLADCLDYVAAPADDVTLILRHTGGNRGKRLLDVVTSSGVLVECQPIKSDADKADFVVGEFRSRRRSIDQEAVRSLIDATGGSLTDLAVACQQLAADTEGTVTTQVVDRYYGGRVEATAFRVADAAIEGRAGQATALLRHALATGVSAPAITGALAMKTRQIARIVDARISQGQVAQVLGMAPWQAKRVSETVRFWNPATIAAAIEWVAQADAEAKGLAKDAEYAVERVVTRIALTARR